MEKADDVHISSTCSDHEAGLRQRRSAIINLTANILHKAGLSYNIAAWVSEL